MKNPQETDYTVFGGGNSGMIARFNHLPPPPCSPLLSGRVSTPLEEGERDGFGGSWFSARLRNDVFAGRRRESHNLSDWLPPLARQIY